MSEERRTPKGHDEPPAASERLHYWDGQRRLVVDGYVTVVVVVVIGFVAMAWVLTR